MMAERRAAAVDRLAAAQQRARHLAHRRNMTAAREARRVAERHQEKEERARVAAKVWACKHQYPLSSYANASIIEVKEICPRGK
jgi:hypothetical protein